jgi:hypothetical protein
MVSTARPLYSTISTGKEAACFHRPRDPTDRYFHATCRSPLRFMAITGRICESRDVGRRQGRLQRDTSEPAVSYNGIGTGWLGRQRIRATFFKEYALQHKIANTCSSSCPPFGARLARSPIRSGSSQSFHGLTFHSCSSMSSFESSPAVVRLLQMLMNTLVDHSVLARCKKIRSIMIEFY